MFGMRSIMLFLSQFGIDSSSSISIWKRWGTMAQRMIEENPYLLCCEEIGMDFDQCEQIARKLNIPLDSSYRIEAAIQFVLRHNLFNGHTCLPMDKLIPTAQNLLSQSQVMVENSMQALLRRREIVNVDVNGRAYCYLPEYLEAERFIASRLKFMIMAGEENLLGAKKKLAQLEEKNGISYASLQQEAILQAISHQIFILTGGPGTGKTTTVAKIIECLLSDKPDLSLKLAAPTGKATARIMQSLEESALRFEPFFPRLVHKLKESELPSRTIHKWLVTPTATGRSPSSDNPIDCDVLIIDEASMIDISLAKELLDVIDTSRTRLILLGDKHQLSAVGPGSVLADLTVKHGAISQCVKELTVSHRFTADSNVGQMAYAINSADDAFEVKTFINRFADSRDGKDAVSVHVPTENTAPLSEAFLDWIRPHMQAYIESLNAYLTLPDQKHLEALWEAIDRFRVFAAQRQGPMSVSAVNAWAEDYVKRALGVVDETIFYPGRLIIIRVNSSDLHRIL